MSTTLPLGIRKLESAWFECIRLRDARIFHHIADANGLHVYVVGNDGDGTCEWIVLGSKGNLVAFSNQGFGGVAVALYEGLKAAFSEPTDPDSRLAAIVRDHNALADAVHSMRGRLGMLEARVHKMEKEAGQAAKCLI